MFFHILTFTDGYSSWVGYGPGVLWTLRAEFWFYVLFPLILMIVGKRHVLKVAVAGNLIGIVAKYQIGHTSRGLGNLAALSFTLEYLDNLMLGAVCAILIERKASIRHFAPPLSHSPSDDGGHALSNQGIGSPSPRGRAKFSSGCL